MTGICFLSAIEIICAVLVLVIAPRIPTTLSDVIYLVAALADSTLSPLLSTKTSFRVLPFLSFGCKA
jgi:hypothetical protein